jgi:hypothetical protein
MMMTHKLKNIVKAASLVGVGNLDIFEHFHNVAKRYVGNEEKHLNIGKRGIDTFAKLVSMMYDQACIDYAEFYDSEHSGEKLSTEEMPGKTEKFLSNERRINPKLEEGVNFALQPEYDSASLFLTLHDYKDIKTKLKGTYNLIRPKGNIFVVEYDFKSWVHQIGNPRAVFKRWFGVRNEKAALKEERDCFEKHTHLGLNEIIQACQDSGFITRHAEAYSPAFPKFSFYVGKKP